MIPELLQQVATGNSTGIRLARFFIVLGVGMVLTRAVLMPVARKVASRKTDNVATQASIENVTGIVSGLFFVSLSMQIAGYGGLVTVLGTVTAALTVAIGFGMREEVGSFVSGVFIQLDRPFLKGDYIEIDGTRGVVDEINLRSTVLENVESDKVVVPNRVITSAPMKNFTKGRRTRASVEVKVPLEGAETARKALDESARSTEDVLEKPEPSTWIEKLEEDKAVIQLECFVSSSRKVDTTRSGIVEKFSGRKDVKKIFEKEEKK